MVSPDAFWNAVAGATREAVAAERAWNWSSDSVAGPWSATAAPASARVAINEPIMSLRAMFLSS